MIQKKEQEVYFALQGNITRMIYLWLSYCLFWLKHYSVFQETVVRFSFILNHYIIFLSYIFTRKLNNSLEWWKMQAKTKAGGKVKVTYI